MKKHFSPNGFTLVEMSIVIVIIGLLIAGVIAGKDLIQNSKIDSIAADMQHYEGAFIMFKKKYLAMPGDMTDAASTMVVNGVLEGAVPTIGSYSSYGNGNGDGILASAAGLSVYASGVTEKYLVWRHMALAGFIKGTYTGFDSNDHSITGDAVNAPAIGKDVPAGPFKNSGYTIYTPVDSLNNYIVSEQIISYGSTNAGAPVTNSSAGLFAGDLTGGVLTPTQTEMLDKKLDDGLPNSGGLQADTSVFNDSAGGHVCATVAPPTCDPITHMCSVADILHPFVPQYKVTEGGTVCHPFYIINNR